VNRQVEALAKGDMAAEVEERREAAQPYVEAKCSDPQVNTIFEWLAYKAGHLVRKATDTETEEDKLQQYHSVEVQLFGIPLFNTKDPVSERLWSMGASQGETVTGWPLKAAAWIAKKMERTGVINLPPDAPMTSDTHVLLENTRYHKKFDNEVDKRRNNALERLHAYVTSNFEERNSSTWHAIKEEFDDEDDAGSDRGGEAPVISYRTLKAMDAAVMERVALLAALEVNASAPEGQTEEGQSVDPVASLTDLLQSLSIRDKRKAVEVVLANHGGGELRMVALALNISLPSAMREWLDDPYADEEVMARLLRHPRVSQQLTNPDIMDPPVVYKLD